MIAIADGASKIFMLVSAPILTRELGPSPYGAVAILVTVTALAATVALVGQDMSYACFFFSGSSEEGRAVERFCWRFTMGAACAGSPNTVTGRSDVNSPCSEPPPAMVNSDGE